MISWTYNDISVSLKKNKGMLKRNRISLSDHSR